jgi:hypothetical protein
MFISRHPVAVGFAIGLHLAALFVILAGYEPR